MYNPCSLSAVGFRNGTPDLCDILARTDRSTSRKPRKVRESDPEETADD